MTPTATTWEEAAAAALIDPLTSATTESAESLAEWVDRHLGAGNWQGIQCEGTLALANLGHPLDKAALVALLASKQHDYGHDNIDRYGIEGVKVRISDKVCRLKNLLSRGATAANESLLDTWTDIVGYAVIATMLEEGTFSLPLSADVKPAPVVEHKIRATSRYGEGTGITSYWTREDVKNGSSWMQTLGKVLHDVGDTLELTRPQAEWECIYKLVEIVDGVDVEREYPF